ncbi:MAG: hypothetical protein M1829_005365 [Trizodia sp. TS-e1964]|nr:MAG: hypothetical protein M1829_005365 [Trizodia sp. TS-e1964]
MSNPYRDLSTPQLHAENERSRRKYHRADAAVRNAGAWNEASGAQTDLIDGPREYYTTKRDNRAANYQKTLDALAERKEPETDYSVGAQLKDSFVGAYKPVLKPEGKGCVVM